jgi:hypothetical protein
MSPQCLRITERYRRDQQAETVAAIRSNGFGLNKSNDKSRRREIKTARTPIRPAGTSDGLTSGPSEGPYPSGGTRRIPTALARTSQARPGNGRATLQALLPARVPAVLAPLAPCPLPTQCKARRRKKRGNGRKRKKNAKCCRDFTLALQLPIRTHLAHILRLLLRERAATVFGRDLLHAVDKIGKSAYASVRA